MNLFDIFRSTLTDMSIVSAITSTVFIILLGFICRKKEIFSESVGKILSKVVLTAALPALAFRAFMQDINVACPDNLWFYDLFRDTDCQCDLWTGRRDVFLDFQHWLSDLFVFLWIHKNEWLEDGSQKYQSDVR